MGKEQVVRRHWSRRIWIVVRKGLELRNQADYHQKRSLYLMDFVVAHRQRSHLANHTVPCSKHVEAKASLEEQNWERDRDRDREKSICHPRCRRTWIIGWENLSTHERCGVVKASPPNSTSVFHFIFFKLQLTIYHLFVVPQVIATNLSKIQSTATNLSFICCSTNFVIRMTR